MNMKGRINPTPYILSSPDEEDEIREKKRKDYRFYSRVLRVVYNKKKLRKKALKELERIENTQIWRIPRAK